MAPERENTSLPGLGTLAVKSYSIDGNDIRAYYDVAGKLVFVIDDTIAADKPNALLIINPVGDRKWDDILANDYGVVLEAIRPKRDNKYQKLDIEYSGLAEYDNLIQDFDNGRDIAAAMAALAGFRVQALRRSAAARLAAAESVARTTRDTIAKTQDTIADLIARLKTLRARLNKYKKAVGTEPTKQSAAKILRTESQIDSTNEKLRRARRRLNNAQRRLAGAEDDATAARRILDAHTDIAVATPHAVMATHAAPTPMVTDTASMPVFKDFATPPATESDTTDNNVTEDMADALPAVAKNLLPEPKAKEMAEEEVKPLFNKDPEILDEEIAFKPIDFGAVPVPDASAQTNANVAPANFADTAPAPLSFAPPSAPAPRDEIAASVPTDDVARAAATQPVLDTLTSVPAAPRPAQQDYMAPAPQPAAPAAEDARPASFGVTPNMATAAMRPASPVSGAPVKPVAAVDSNSGNRGKPSFLYYLMLIALIVMSVLTLWLYQKSTRDNVPDLASTVSTGTDQAAVDNEESPFFVADEPAAVVADVVEETPTVVEEAAVIITEPQPVEVEAPVVPVVDETAPLVPVAVDDNPIVDEDVSDGPFLSQPAPQPAPAEPVVNKPVYNAGPQNENMFVAAPDYETDSVTVVDMYDNPVSYDNSVSYDDSVSYETVTSYDNVTSYDAPVVHTEEPAVVPVPDQAAAPLCEDGSPVDANGCCPGEDFTNSPEGFVCCSAETGECFRPLV